MNLQELERFVLAEIESYRYEVAQGALGRAQTDEWVERQLVEMRAALVKPEWRLVKKRDTFEEIQRDAPEQRRCALVADDDDGQLQKGA